MWDIHSISVSTVADQFQPLYKQVTVGNDENKAGQNYFHLLMWLRGILEVSYLLYRLYYYFLPKPFQKVLGSQNKPAVKLITHLTHQKQCGFIVNSYREPEH